MPGRRFFWLTDHTTGAIFVLSNMRNDESIHPIDLQLQAVADRTRLRILLFLAKGERCVCDIVNALQLPQPKVSRHLATLRAAGLVRSRIHANWRHYTLAEPQSEFHRKLIDCILCCVPGIPELAGDAERAGELPACCPVNTDDPAVVHVGVKTSTPSTKG